MGMTAGRSVFVDTNILVYATVAESPFHEAAVERLREMGAESRLWISWQVIREYLAVVTRPDALIPPLSRSVLIRCVRRFQSQFAVATESARVPEAFLMLAEKLPVSGRRIHDANIVATMIAYDIPFLLTHNIADFRGFRSYVQCIPLIGTAAQR